MIYFLGTSHAATNLRNAAIMRGVRMAVTLDQAKIVFVSEDTPTDENGNRDLGIIRELLRQASAIGCPIVLTSQVPPGFTRSLGLPHIYHQAETLRIKDAEARALSPDYIVVGCLSYQSYELLPEAYRQYLEAFRCPVKIVTYEDAEFSKIAVNMTLAAQVDNTNRLAKAAQQMGANWWHVAEVLRLDSRIGPHSYLMPGRWQDSKHLLRDYVTLKSLAEPSSDFLKEMW